MNQLHLQNDEPQQNAYAPPKNTVRDNANAVNTQTTHPPAASQMAAAQAVTTQFAPPVAAQAALKPEYVTLLLGEVENRLNRHFLLKTAAHGLAAAAVTAFVYGLYHPALYGYTYTFIAYTFDNARDVTMPLALAAITGSPLCYYLAAKMRRSYEKRVLAIADMNDPRVLGALFEAVQTGDKVVRQTARQALLRLLPTLKMSDSAALSAEQKQALSRGLTFKNPELTLAILKALEQVGDASAIPFVEKIAKGRGDVSRDWQIMEAANDCLPFLQMRAEDRQAAAQLLRPAAYAANQTDAEQLLRATTSEES